MTFLITPIRRPHIILFNENNILKGVMQWVNINIKIAYVPMAIIVCKPVGSKLSRHRMKV